MACPTCTGVTPKADYRDNEPAPVLPAGLQREETLFSGHYRDRFGDNCDRQETLYRCQECAQLWYQVRDTDMQMLGWRTHEWTKPVAEGEANELRAKKSESRDEPYDP